MKKFILLLLLLLLSRSLCAQQIYSLSPNFSPPTVTPYTLTVTGSGFVGGATVLWSGTPLQTTFISGQQLTAVVPCCFSYGVSTISVTVTLPSGDTSLPSTFKNFGTSAPVTSFTPTSFSAGVAASVKVHGNYFTSGCVIYFDNHPEITTFSSQTLITANVPGGDVDGRHTHSIYVLYPTVSSLRLTPAVLSFTPTSLGFPTIPVGTSTSEVISVANVSNLPITISSTVIIGAAFSYVTTCSSPMAPSTGCTYTVTFTPLAVGTFTGQITITDTGVNSPHVISFYATAAGPGGPSPPPSGPLASFSPLSLSFGNIATGSSSSPQTVTLTNTGASPLTISAVALTGAGATSYSISDACVAASPLAPLASCSVSAVTFTPLATGSLSATISFTDNVPGSPQLIPLSGTGTGAHSVDVAWTASASGGITGYNVYRGTVSGGPYSRINASLISGVAYTDYTVVSSGHYCYVVTSFANTGYNPAESVNSGESCATVP